MTQKAFTLDADFYIAGYTDKLEKDDDVSLLFGYNKADLLDEDWADISDWADDDTGDSESTQVTFDGKSCLKSDSGATSAANNYRSKRSKDIGSYPNTFVLKLENYHSALGIVADLDGLALFCLQTDERFSITFASDGLFIYDNDEEGWVEVGTNLVKSNGSAEWQEWIYVVTFTGTTGEGTCDIYLNDSTHAWIKVGTAVPCSFETGGTDGGTEILQYGYATDNRISYMSYIKAQAEHNLYADDSPQAKFKKSGEDYTINIGSGKKLNIDSFAATTSEPAGTSIKYRWVKDDNGTWPAAGWSAWLTSTELNTAITNGDLDGLQYIYVEMQLNSDGMDKCVLSDGTFNFTTLIRKIVDAGAVNKLVDAGVLAKIVG